MLKLFFSIFILLNSLFVMAQEQTYSVDWTTQQLDSVKIELRKSTNDTLRMKMARQLGVYHQEINRDTSLYYHQLQITLAKKLIQPLWEADGYDSGGWVLAQLKNYPLSLEYLLIAMKMAVDNNTEKNIWQLSHFSKKLDPAYARLTSLGYIYNDISQLYRQTGDADKEVAHLRYGINIASDIGNDGLLGLLKSNLSKVKLDAYQSDSAIYYGKESLAHMTKSGYKTYEGYVLGLLADSYIQKNELTTAKNYIDQSVIANQVNRSLVMLPDAYFSYARFYKMLGQPDSNSLYLYKAIEGFNSFSLLEKVNKGYALLYEFYKEQNNADSAYHYLQLYQQLSDSLNEKEKKQVHAYQNAAFNEQINRQKIESDRIKKANTIRTYALVGGITVLLLIAFLLFQNNRNRRKANILLQQQKTEIEQQKITVENTLTELKSTQQQLIQSEKMASLGELTAGIAHEIQNPLNFVNNFSEVNKELLVEMKDEIKKANLDEVNALADDLIANEEKINHHGKRADAIVKGMLQHSRTSSGQNEPTDINLLADEYLRLAYQGLRAKEKSFNATLKTDYDESISKVNIIPQDIGRVILNLITNAFYVVDEKKKQNIEGYEPTVFVSTKKMGDTVEVRVKDNGSGIPQKILDKIFQPFFTTKPTGQGTGLGLSLAYDIVKAHGGELKVETKDGEGTTFIIELAL